jgi:hypothetical protein
MDKWRNHRSHSMLQTWFSIQIFPTTSSLSQPSDWSRRVRPTKRIGDSSPTVRVLQQEWGKLSPVPWRVNELQNFKGTSFRMTSLLSLYGHSHLDLSSPHSATPNTAWKVVISQMLCALYEFVHTTYDTNPRSATKATFWDGHIYPFHKGFLVESCFFFFNHIFDFQQVPVVSV